MKKSLSEVLSLTFKELGSNWKYFLKVFALFVVIPSFILFALIQLILFEGYELLGSNSNPVDMGFNELISFFTQQPVFSYAILVVVFFILVMLFNVLTRAILVNYSFKDEKLKRASSLYDGKKYFWKLLGLDIFEFLIFFLIFAILSILPIFILITNDFSSIDALSANPGGAIALVISIILLILIFLISLVYLAVKWVFASYILINENKGVIESLRMSWKMTRSNFWLTLGMLLIFILILIGINLAVAILNGIITFPISFAYGVNSLVNSQEVVNLPFHINFIVSFVNQVFGFIQNFIGLLFGILFIKNLYIAYRQDAPEKKTRKS